MSRWLALALDYVPRWIEFQMLHHEQPGCALAIVHRGRVVLQTAFGHADLSAGLPLTPRHRFRAASHTKSFTAAGILKLRDQGRLRLDDALGQYVKGLHPALARATLAQVLSHTAGVVRDGADSGQFVDSRPFVDRAELMGALASPPVIEANTRFKYSNHGYGLAGLVIETLTGEAYLDWLQREIIDAAGLEDTCADMPVPKGTPVARGHSAKQPLGRRVIIPGDYTTNAIAPAAGVVSTARDLAAFFGQLSPGAKRSVLSVAARREMIRRQWRNPHSSLERYYGLGIISGTLSGCDWFGHSGGLQGYVTRTNVLPRHELAISVLTNAIDGLAQQWLEGIIHIIAAFERHGAPARRLSGWTGRWWNLWGAVDLLPMGDRVFVASPEAFNPLLDAGEIAVEGRDAGRIAVANGYEGYGEPARLVRTPGGKVKEVWLGGSRRRPRAVVAKEMSNRYRSCR